MTMGSTSAARTFFAKIEAAAKAVATPNAFIVMARLKYYCRIGEKGEKTSNSQVKG